MGNQIRTTVLLAAMTALIVFAGNLLGGQQGMILAFIIAAGMNFFSYWFSDKIVLKMYRAQEVTDQQAPEVYDMVRELARRAQLPMPKVYIIPQEAPNAFATGRNPRHAVVAVTQGLLQLMSREEVMGVLAHELAHIKNRDILIGSIAATMAGAIMILASMARWFAFFGGGRSDDDDGGIIGLIAMTILAPIAAMIIQMAISRSREYLADATGAGFAGRPEGLARALEKLGQYSKRLPMHASGSATSATAHMFIVNPLSGRSLRSLFSTHPPLEERIARLRGNPPVKPDVDSGTDRREANARAVWDRLSE
ncbi:MAG: zinc metalloprotease HtpX [Deltaproteobacteria bacterium]|jgi:heat shock protein HtpX|nr:zinc metalloprotease HtpX [Deltaproteobacteria bacterium]